jgi:hypothetical protein
MEGTPLLATSPKISPALSSSHRLKLRKCKMLRTVCWLNASLEGVSFKGKGRIVRKVRTLLHLKDIGLGRYRL